MNRVSAGNHFLPRFVERDTLPGVHSGNSHAQGYRVIVSGLNIGIGFFPASNTLHPVPHVGEGGVIRSCVGCGFDPTCFGY